MIIYVIIISIVAFVIYGFDKYRAISNKWRISENTLLSLAALGGAIGALLGMIIFRHKIRKPIFLFGIPLFIIVQFIYVILIQ